MAAGDRVEITEIPGGWSIQLDLITADPNSVLGAIQGLLAQRTVPYGTIRDVETQQSEDSAENYEPNRTEYHDTAEEAAEQDDPDDVAYDLTLDQQYDKLASLNELMAQRRTPSGYPFGHLEWEEGVRRFCPNIDSVEAALLRGEYLSQRRADTDDDDTEN